MGLFDKEKIIANRAALEASKILMSFYKKSYSIIQKSDQQGPVTTADLESHACIVSFLKKEFPQDAILSEEGVDDKIRLTKKRVWCIDPLDGTKNFIEKTDEFSIHIALIVEERAVFGFVYLPVPKIAVWGTVQEGAFWKEEGQVQRIHCAWKRKKEFILMRSRHHVSSEDFFYFKQLSPNKIKEFGSVGGKALQLLRGHADLFFYVSALFEWDTCAPEVILRSAGGVVVDFLGKPLLYNQKNPLNGGGIIFSRGTFYKKILKIKKDFLHSSDV